jgi:hypothetical protein
MLPPDLHVSITVTVPQPRLDTEAGAATRLIKAPRKHKLRPFNDCTCNNQSFTILAIRAVLRGSRLFYADA